MFTNVLLDDDRYSAHITNEFGGMILAATEQITQALNNAPSLGGGFEYTNDWYNMWRNNILEIGLLYNANGYYYFVIETVDHTPINEERITAVKDAFQTAAGIPAGSGRHRKSRKTKSRKVSRKRRSTRRY